MVVELPEHVREEVAPLGEPLAVFPARASHSPLYAIMGGLGLLVGAAVAVFLVALLMRFPPRQMGDLSVVGLLVALSLLAVGGGLGLFRRARQTGGVRVLVCPRGLARADAAGADITRWPEVRQVRWDTEGRQHELTLTPPVQLVLVREYGPPLAITEDVSRLPELRRRVEEHTLPHLLAEALEALREGDTVRFGPVAVNQEGIAYPGGTLRWGHVGDARVANGKLFVWHADTRHRVAEVARSRTPNLHVLLALVERFGTRTG